MKIPTFEELAKGVAGEATRSLEVNDIPLAEFLARTDGVADFLKREIRICEERLQNDKSNPFYDGVGVGVKEAQKLKSNHIRFCKKLLEMMNFGGCKNE